MKFKNILVSVSDKTGLDSFVQSVLAPGGRVVSTGGTAKFLIEAGVNVTPIKEQTDFPEVMDGRVRTLHPRVHVPLLARHWVKEDQELLNEMNLEPFDLVVCNLYPFESAMRKEGATPREITEMIDIGGPTLLRAAAKNWETITVVCDPEDYPRIETAEEISESDKMRLLSKVFNHVSSYDAMIAEHFSGGETDKFFSLGGEEKKSLRYGENPHQKATWFRKRGDGWGLSESRQLQGKELSYNNLLDLDAAVTTLRRFDRPTAISVKHNNPCGIASSDKPLEALVQSLRADPVSVFGGIVAVNFEISGEMAGELSSLFLECIIAPKVSDEAARLLAKKKNLRVLEWERMCENREVGKNVRSILGGFLVQGEDVIRPWNDDLKVIGKTPDGEMMRNLFFGWTCVASLKSNAISITSGEMSLGMGMGQVNRVDAVKQSIDRWKEHHPNINENIVLSSDAFFPFPDSIELAAEAGIHWIVQPGGSIKDGEVIKRAEELGVNMILTGERHFQH